MGYVKCIKGCNSETVVVVGSQNLTTTIEEAITLAHPNLGVVTRKWVSPHAIDEVTKIELRYFKEKCSISFPQKEVNVQLRILIHSICDLVGTFFKEDKKDDWIPGMEGDY